MHTSFQVIVTTMLVAACYSACPDAAAVAGVDEPRFVDRPSADVHCLAFSPDHRVVAIGEDGNDLRLIEFDSGATLAQLKGHTDTIVAVAFSPDGLRVATAGLDGSVRIWDLASSRQLGQVDSVPRCIDLAFAPDGRTLASGHYDRSFIGLMFWDLTQDGLLRASKRMETRSSAGRVQLPHLLRYSPDGCWLVFGQSAVNVLDVSSGEIRNFESSNISKSPISSYLFVDDRGWLVAASYYGELNIWDVTSGRLLFRLPINGPTAAVMSRLTSMARVRGTEVVLVGSAHNTIAVWNLAARTVLSRSAIADLPDGRNLLSKLILSEDGLGLAVVTEGKIYLFNVDGFSARQDR